MNEDAIKAVNDLKARTAVTQPTLDKAIYNYSPVPVPSIQEYQNPYWESRNKWYER